MQGKLLDRDNFRNLCLERDKGVCVICGDVADAVHHIIERRLFSDGGYYLDNGASLCERCHIEAEETTLACEDIRQAAGIPRIILPEHFYDDLHYDKWGNILLTNGHRFKGDLFYDESVQKILGQGKVLDLFQKYIKYPRTYHLPWSTATKDDKLLKDESNFVGKKVVVTLKMDGENTTMYNDYVHARSINSGGHETRKWVKGLWAQISYMIDENMRICGENLYALHSVKYTSLPSYFMVFSIWFDNKCIGWNETVEYTKILGLETVPVIYEGIYDKLAIQTEFTKYATTNEGYVVRLYDEFSYMDFKKSIAKYVSPAFRQQLNNSHGHWISKKIEPNELAKNI